MPGEQSPPPFGIRKVSKRRWLIAGVLSSVVVGVAPFAITSGKGARRTTMFESMGWAGVIAVWLFMGAALGLTYWDQLRRERIAKELGLLVDDNSHFLDK